MKNPGKRLIYFDCTRLLRKIKSKNPSGIERTDIEYLKRIFDRTEEFDVRGLFEIVNKTNGLNYFIHIDGALLERIMRLCHHRWIENEPVEGSDDQVSQEILDVVAGDIRGVSLKPGTRIDSKIYSSCDEYGKRASYLNCSFITIPDGELHAQQMSQLPVKPFYIVYDLLPIEFPEYMWNDKVSKNHLDTLRVLATSGSNLIAISEYVKEGVESVLCSLDIQHSEIHVAPCGVSDTFLSNRIASPGSYRPQNKFTIFCTIEPRKNHVLLLNIWRELMNQGFSEIPRLSIIGRRGWSNETTFRFLDKSPALREYVTEFNDLGDEDMVSEILSSKATLFPSFGEGWGLPIVESLTLGIPVICSDLKVHRECSQGHAEFLHPLDGLGWMDRIKQISRGSRDDDVVRQRSTHTFEPITWARSAANIVEIINRQV